MRTAISVDDDLVTRADRVARQMGVTRSRLFSLALENYLCERRHEAELKQLNRVYAGGPPADEQHIVARMKAKFRPTIRDRW